MRSYLSARQRGRVAAHGAPQQAPVPVIGFLHLTSLETNRENLATFFSPLRNYSWRFRPKDGDLRVVYARIGGCQGRPAWRGA
jgi:hypothetical protein